MRKICPLKIKGRYFTFFIVLISSVNLFAQPTITSFSPTSGSIGTSVTINGTNFNATLSNDIVYFGAVKANVIAATTTSLTVTVPAGTTYQPITVTVNNLTAYSNKPFDVTFSGAAPQFTAQSFEYVAHVDSIENAETTKYAIGDLDNDGKIDVVTIDRLSNTMSVYRNTTAGGIISFGSKINFTTGQSPRSVSVGDIDGDGKLDVVVSNLNDNTVSIFKNTTMSGAISFAPRVNFGTAIQPAAISITDIDKDGKADLVVNTVNLNGYVSVLRNTSTSGLISFAPKTDLQLLGGSIEEIRTADIDGDGKADIVLPNFSLNAITIFRNISSPGNISFASKVDIAINSLPDKIEISDLNDDGKPDIVYGLNVSFYASILRNTSTPGNISFNLDASYNVWTSTGRYSFNGIAISDLDGDGKPDMAINTGSDFVALFKNNSSTGGNISFTYSYPGTYLASPWNAPFVTGDFDNDGKPDLAFKSGIYKVTIWKNRTTSPQIISFSPSSGTTGTTVTIQGFNFSGINSVSFGGVRASSFTVVNATTITAVVDSGTSGDIVIKSSNDSARIQGFIFSGPPIITSFSPNFAAADSLVTIIGLNFGEATQVTFGGTPASTFSIVSPTIIQAVVASGSSGDISVATPYGTGKLAGFIYIPSPKIISFNPTSAGTGTTVTIKGLNFTGTTSVSFGGTAVSSFTIVDSATINAVVGNGASGNVSVTNNFGTGIISGFTYIPSPTISSFSPTSAATGATVTITGTNFSGANSVAFGGILASFNVVSPNTITAVIGAGSSGNVSVTTRGGTALLSGFVYIPPPYITNFSPKTTGAGAIVIITGSNLNLTTAVSFGGVPASSFTIVDSSTIKAVVGNGSSGYVTVASTGGTASVWGFTFTTVPVINSVSPALGTVSTPVTITGANFSTTSANNIVHFGAVQAPIISSTTNTIAVLVPPGATYQPITVTTNGLIASSSSPFMVTFSGGGSFNANSFAGRTDFVTNKGPESIATGDLDADGKPDVVVANSSSNSISIFRNTSIPGTLSFASKIDSAAGFYPHAVKIADIDGDGKLDIILLNYDPSGATTDNTVSIFRNISSPGIIAFDARIVLSNQYYHPSDLAVVDLDLDGKPDLAMVHFGTYIPYPYPGEEFVSVLRNTSTPVNISFANVQTFYSTSSAPFYSSTISVADINNDNKPDLIVGYEDGYFVSLMINQSIPGFINLQHRSSANYGNEFNGRGFNHAATADFDGDGKTDVITDDERLRNTSSTTFISFDVQPKNGIGGILAIGGLSGDGKPDFARVNPNTNTVSAVKNSGSPGCVCFEPDINYNTGINPRGIAITDFNGDGKPDIAVSNTNFNTFSILLNNIGDTNRPIISSFSPAVGSKGTVDTIIGSNFVNVTGVSFGGILASSFTIVSDTMLIAVVDSAASGNVNVTTSLGTASLGWFYGLPSITSFTPTSTGPSMGVTINGTNFIGTMQVSFGGVPANFTVLSSTTISAKISNGASGDVSVTTPAGTTSLSGFTFVQAPIITSFSPTSGGPETPVTIMGKNFAGAVSVSFGGMPAKSFTVLSDTAIVAVVGNGATGNVTVTTTGGTAGGQIFSFGIPEIIQFTPTHGGTGTTITIRGNNFYGITGVSFGGMPATSFSVIDQGAITAVVGNGASGDVTISMAGSTISLSGFTYDVVTAVGNINGNSNDLKVYPNPAQNYLVIEHPATSKSAYIQCIDISGRIVKTVSVKRNETKTKLDSENLSGGVYKISWTDGTNSLSRTIMILK